MLCYVMFYYIILYCIILNYIYIILYDIILHFYTYLNTYICSRISYMYHDMI